MGNNILFERAVERKSLDPDAIVKIAFNEILGTIYSSEIEEKELDNLIEKMGFYVIEKIGIQENELNWQVIDEWRYQEQYILLDYYLDFDEAKKIINKSKRDNENDWETLYSKNFPFKKIHDQMLQNFKENIDFDISYRSTEELLERYKEKA